MSRVNHETEQKTCLDGAYRISAPDSSGFHRVCNSTLQSLHPHEAWSATFVWIADLSTRSPGSPSAIICFAALIFLFLPFALVVMYYEERSRINAKHLDVFVT